MTVRVTEHAIDRYIERIAPFATRDAVHAIILGAARGIVTAAAIGCEVVRISGGARLILQGDVVVTVVRCDSGFPRALKRHGDLPDGD